VHVGTIAERVGNPFDTDPWEWSCGFYPGSHPGEHRSDTAATFEDARADFERAWQVFLSNRTEADFQNGAMREIGPNGNTRCGMLANGWSRRTMDRAAVQPFYEMPLRRGLRHARAGRGADACASHHGGGIIDMKPSTYLEVICKPHLHAFEADPTAISKAWSAVVSLGQFADYLAADRNISKRAARKLIESVFPKFDLVSDIANASKHFELSDPTRTSRAGYSITHLKIGKSAAFTDGTFFSDGLHGFKAQTLFGLISRATMLT